MIVFLCSDKASYITGQDFIVDGGNTIQEYKGSSSERLCPTLAYHMDYWQFSSSCTVAGISGRVDMNIQFARRQAA